MKTHAKKLLLLPLLSIGLLSAGLTQAAPPPAHPELFAEFKRLESRSHQGRIAILQEAEICIQQAQNREQFRACEQKEKAGREALREELRPQREALRAKIQAIRQEAQPL
ncbi:MAG: hypothetical protein AB1717_03970 [Pseudomonadota bacterium]